MRTTLTLDPDVSAMIERELADKKTSLKAVVNDRLRRGFAVSATRLTYDIPEALDLGPAVIRNFDNIAEILEWIEDDPH